MVAQQQAQMVAQQQQMQAMQQNALVDLQKTFQMQDPMQRKQEIGNGIFGIISQSYGEYASKITGMLLDNERIVDHFKLVTDRQYLQEKAQEAYQLLAQSATQQQVVQNQQEMVQQQ